MEERRRKGKTWRRRCVERGRKGEAARKEAFSRRALPHPLHVLLEEGSWAR